jgi:NAD-dependent dihydropyrimidine dehydrogenase PreA subunit
MCKCYEPHVASHMLFADGIGYTVYRGLIGLTALFDYGIYAVTVVTSIFQALNPSNKRKEARDMIVFETNAVLVLHYHIDCHVCHLCASTCLQTLHYGPRIG